MSPRDEPLMDRLTSSAIKLKARELGFDLCGVAPAAELPELTFFEKWLSRGYAGDMAYLHRSRERRADVRRVLPSAETPVATSSLCQLKKFVTPALASTLDRERMPLTASQMNASVPMSVSP